MFNAKTAFWAAFPPIAVVVVGLALLMPLRSWDHRQIARASHQVSKPVATITTVKPFRQIPGKPVPKPPLAAKEPIKRQMPKESDDYEVWGLVFVGVLAAAFAALVAGWLLFYELPRYLSIRRRHRETGTSTGASRPSRGTPSAETTRTGRIAKRPAGASTLTAGKPGLVPWRRPRTRAYVSVKLPKGVEIQIGVWITTEGAFKWLEEGEHLEINPAEEHIFAVSIVNANPAEVPLKESVRVCARPGRHWQAIPGSLVVVDEATGASTPLEPEALDYLLGKGISVDPTKIPSATEDGSGRLIFAYKVEPAPRLDKRRVAMVAALVLVALFLLYQAVTHWQVTLTVMAVAAFLYWRLFVAEYWRVSRHPGRLNLLPRKSWWQWRNRWWEKESH
jgi:hypothetical protein